ncbi:hypothetical protein JRO89_XS04G0173400 [Xanthoceras sorbifolium]|uniref:Uncharacterized protein n=1 Tax=Xanthoceras sorbifolium TaxID=99658 RepID=A0ABQ8I5P4_9ROSI|nr:hypothetical protein JRO89_XS04G0173400 [Xanthoceras sorbifolium]
MGDQDGSWPKQVASIAHGRCAPSKKPRVDGELLFIGLTSTAVPAREAIEELEAQKTEHEKITSLSCYDVVRGLASLLGGEALAASARVALKAAVGGFSEKSAARRCEEWSKQRWQTPINARPKRDSTRFSETKFTRTNSE